MNLQVGNLRLVRLLFVSLFAAVLSWTLLHSESRGEMLAPEGVEIVDITACAGLLGHYSPVSGNVSTPLAVFDPNNIFISYLSMSEDTWNQQDELANPSRVVVTKYDGETCTTPVELTSNTRNPGNPAHNAPSVYVDGHGYVYVTYGLGAGNADTLNAPFVRRSVNPLDPSAFEPAQRMRLWQGAELNGFTMKDGSVLFTGTDIHARFDIALPYEPSGPSPNYLHTASKQPVTSVHDASYSRDGLCAANRFTKGVMKEGVGADDNLYIIWGYSSSGPNSGQCWIYDQDYQHYTTDSHEMFFAYSEDGGITWTNLTGTKTVEAGYCEGPLSTSVCKNNPDAGILFNDDDYRINNTRQIEYRQMWADPDGTIYVAFVKSNWCDEGLCDDPNTRISTDPGSLMLLRFRLGDTRAEVEEFVINSHFHYWISAIRRDPATGKLYVWAHEQSAGGRTTHNLYEYVSEDDGETWSRTQINPSSGVGACHRMHGDVYTPFVKNSVYILFTCRTLAAEPSGNAYSHLYLFRRSFAHDTELPAGWASTDIGAGQAAGASSYWADGTYLVHGAGAGIGSTADAQRYVYQEMSGDFEIQASILEIENTGGSALAGVMIRSSHEADAGHAFLGLTPGGGPVVSSTRPSIGAAATVRESDSASITPAIVKLTRVGQTVSGFLSRDGVNWQRVFEESLGFGNDLLVGLAVSSGRDDIRNTTTFTDVSVSNDVYIPPADPLVLPDGALPLSDPWLSGSIGSGHRDGAAGELDRGRHYIVGTGTGIGDNSEQLHMAWQVVEGDFSFSTRILETGAAGGQTGIMIREMAAANSRFAYIGLHGGSPCCGVMAFRDSIGGATVQTSIADGVASPYWVKLERLGNTIKGHISEDGRNWTTVSSAQVSMNARVLVGFSHASGAHDQYTTAVYGNTSLVQGPWSETRIGQQPGDGNTRHMDGFARHVGFDLALNGAGAGAADGADALQYVYRQVEEDITFITRIDKAGAGNQAAQSGVMFRESLDADSRMVFLTIRPNGGLSLMSRESTGGSIVSSHLNQASGSYWLRLDKTGNQVTASYSNDRIHWQDAGSVTVDWVDAFLVGAAASSPNSQQASAWSFRDITLLPAHWRTEDIGPAGLPGHVLYEEGRYTVYGTGLDIWNTEDAFRYVYQEIEEENAQIVIRVDHMSNSSPIALAGAMIRTSQDSDAAHYMTGVRVDGVITSKYRGANGGATTSQGSVSGASLPVWLMLQKEGNTITAFRSVDGNDWIQVNQPQTIALDGSYLIGFVAQAGTNASYHSTVVSQVSVGEIEPVEPDYALPGGWVSEDIGSVGLEGEAVEVFGSFTLTGSGASIDGTADQFHFAHQKLTGDGSIVARIADLTHGIAGVMMREGAGDNDRHVFVGIRAVGDTRFLSRNTVGGQTIAEQEPGSDIPYWVRLDRTGNTFEGYHSEDGVNWTLVGAVTVPMDPAIRVGLAVASQDNALQGTGTFDQVTVSQDWYSLDIGAVGVPGGFRKDGGVITVTGSGRDVFDTNDEFHYVYQNMTGNGMITARLISVEGGGQSGLMMRDTLSVDSSHAFLTIRSIGGIRYKGRPETGGLTANASATGNAPHWIRLVRNGDSFEGYRSADGENWTFVAAYSIPMGQEIHVGLAVTSHNNNALNTSVFEHITISPQP